MRRSDQSVCINFEFFERCAAPLLDDPWAARDAYIDVVLDRSRANVERFVQEQAKGAAQPDQLTRNLELLELQRHSMRAIIRLGKGC